MNKKMDELIRRADEALKNTQRVKILDATYSYPQAFKGYISAFGAAVVMSGIRPAMAFYINRGSAEDERGQLLNAIALMLDPTRHQHKEAFTDGQQLFKHSLTLSDAQLKKLSEDICNCAVALKLALRTYPQKGKEGTDGN